MSTDETELNALTGEIIRCAFAVGNGLGAGFLEKVYESNASSTNRQPFPSICTNLRLSVFIRVHLWFLSTS